MENLLKHTIENQIVEPYLHNMVLWRGYGIFALVSEKEIKVSVPGETRYFVGKEYKKAAWMINKAITEQNDWNFQWNFDDVLW